MSKVTEGENREVRGAVNLLVLLNFQSVQAACGHVLGNTESAAGPEEEGQR